MTEGHIGFADHLLSVLAPLSEGRTVSLVIESQRRHGRKTIEVKTGVLLAPGPIYGMLPETVVVSVLGSGSCVIFPKANRGLGPLVKAGVPVALARELMDKLNVLYGE